MSSQRQLTDIISLIRFALGLDSELKPFSGHCSLQKLWSLFSVSDSNSSGQNNELDSLLAEMNQELIA
ncbi:hypothetical protein THF5G08_350009 [Vibrio jasicida]|nr:hypothetical protein THF5G08_350009 [Vibrio jasicida]